MDQLGFTFYPRDWWTSDKFIELELGIERYLYLECLFMMYMDPNGVRNDRLFISKKLRLEIPPAIWENVTKAFIISGDFLQSETVKKRRTKADQARINGSKGGAPKKPKNPENVTQGTQPNNPNNPPSEIKENRNEMNIPSVGKGIYSDNGAFHKPAKPLPPLRAVGFAGGKVLPAVWKKYAALAYELADRQDLEPARMASGFVYFWPYEIDQEKQNEISKRFAELDEIGITSMIGQLAADLDDVKTEKFNSVIEFIL